MLCCCLAFAGCSAAAPETVYIVPPEHFLVECGHPRVPDEMKDASDLRAYSVGATRLILEYQHALDVCNADKAAVREWIQSVKEAR